MLLTACHLVEQRHSFKSTSYKRSKTYGHLLPLHPRPLSPYHLPTFGTWKNAFITLISPIGWMRGVIRPITTAIWQSVHGCQPPVFNASSSSSYHEAMKSVKAVVINMPLATIVQHATTLQLICTQ